MSRKPYTIEEKRKIVQYIIDHHSYKLLRGAKLWQEMETLRVCGDRTWQSMKEHFRRNIIDNLHRLPFEKIEIDRIREGYQSTKRPPERKRHNTVSVTVSPRRREDELPLPPKRSSPNQSTDTVLISDSDDAKLPHTPLEPYRLEDDANILLYFHQNLHLLKDKHLLQTYKEIQKKYHFKRPCSFLRHRLLNVILPNIDKYKQWIDMDAMITIIRADVDTPAALEQIIDQQTQESQETICISDTDETNRLKDTAIVNLD